MQRKRATAEDRGFESFPTKWRRPSLPIHLRCLPEGRRNRLQRSNQYASGDFADLPIGSDAPRNRGLATFRREALESLPSEGLRGYSCETLSEPGRREWSRRQLGVRLSGGRAGLLATGEINEHTLEPYGMSLDEVMALLDLDDSDRPGYTFHPRR